MRNIGLTWVPFVRRRIQCDGFTVRANGRARLLSHPPAAAATKCFRQIAVPPSARSPQHVVLPRGRKQRRRANRLAFTVRRRRRCTHRSDRRRPGPVPAETFHKSAATPSSANARARPPHASIPVEFTAGGGAYSGTPLADLRTMSE